VACEIDVREARLVEYQRAWQANRDGFAPVVIAQ
jgi:hypothetical protein